MKKILYVLLAASVLFACNKPQEQEVKPSDDPSNPSVVFEVDEIEPLSAEAQTLSVNVKTNVEFDVVVPAEVTWIKYLATKAAAPASEAKTKTVEFAISLNEEDKMRQASVALNDKDGKTLKSIAIMQKAGGGIEIEVEVPEEPFPVEGGSFELKVTSNVPFSAVSEVDWIKATAGEDKVTLELEPNSGIEPREGTVNIYREGTDNLISTFTITQAEPHVIMAEEGYADLASALEAYHALTEGPVNLILAAGTHVGDIVVGPDNVPLNIQGNGVATLDGTIEVKGKAVSIEGITIAPSQEGSLPVFETSFNYQHGIMIHDTGFGVTISDVTIDMSKLASDATGIFLLAETTGWSHDKVRGVTIDGGASGHRLMQVYGAVVSITGCTFTGPYSSYAVRVGNEKNDVVLANNVFEGTAGCAVHFNNLKDSRITLGNGIKDNNQIASSYSTAYKANSDVTVDGNTFSPVVEYNDGVLTIYVDPEAMATLSRVWGHYNGNRGTWDDEITLGSNWNRNAVIMDDYVYVTIAGNEDKGQDYGVAVFSLADGSYIRTIKEGFGKDGFFYTDGITKVGYDIFVSNMACPSLSSSKALSTDKLVVYKLVDYDGDGIPTKAEVALEYTITDDQRYGDKMTSFLAPDGSAIIGFCSYSKTMDGNRGRKYIEFQVEDGNILPDVFYTNDQPNNYLYCSSSNDCTAGIDIFFINTGHIGAGSTRQALYASGSDLRFDVGWWYGDPSMWFNCGTGEMGADGSELYSLFAGEGFYDKGAIDPRIFTHNGNRYLAYTYVEQDTNNRSCGYLRFVKINDSPKEYTVYWLLNCMWYARDKAECFQRYAIGDTDDYYAVGDEATNKTGFCDVLQTESGETYIMAGITSTGMSLFKVD